MKITTFLRSYIPTFLVLFIANFLAQGVIFRSHNASYLGTLVKPMEELVFPILIFTYLVHSAVLVFIVSKLLKTPETKTAFLLCGAYGALLLFHANIVNIFILPSWPWQVAISDTLASFVTYGSAGLVGFLLKPKNNAK